MSPDYARVEALYHAALELPPESRAAYVADACGTDIALRREVESLLGANAAAGDFISAPAIDLAAQWLVQDDPALVGSAIGAYDGLTLVGRGGMGQVYAARDTRLGRRVALKLLRPSLTANADAVRRFEQEARAASSLNHPNIVTIYEIGEIDAHRFLAMEFVEGRSLAAMTGTRCDLATLARVGAQLARALAVAHAAGIVHRDIKPENAIIRDDGYVKLLDFGLARLLPSEGLTPSSDRSSNPRLILGTPRYMSPEQARGALAGPESDIFSLGVVLYELATAVHPFDAESTLGTLHAIATRPLTPVDPAIVPPRVERLLRRMLDKAASERPSATEVEAELTRIAAGVPESIDDRGDGADRRLTGHAPPAQRTPLLGRTGELAAVAGMLRDRDTRLITLTGPGGTGKTRLAVQVAADVARTFEGGVAFVNLAPIADPGLVAAAVASALGVRESGERVLMSAVVAHLSGLGSALLVLDNFEQVIEAAALVRELLDACPSLKVLVTSRVVLHIYGEHEFPVPPLDLPPAEGISSPEALMQSASIALFVQRAVAVRPDFALTPANAGAVVHICRRLDGLPLAIELAAARVKILPPAELQSRLDRRLELLTGGPRDLPKRQQTLRSTIKWSYDLLTPEEQTLFRRLSVFAGGCTLESIEAVCNTREDLGVSVVDGVTSLVDSSLLVQRLATDAEPRFTMLETFREYGRERLAGSGEAADVQRAHAAYMLVLGEEETLEMTPAERASWLRDCDAEHDNFRAAIQNLMTVGNAEWTLRLAGALFRFWEDRNHLAEGRETLDRVLAMPGAEARTRARARALYACSVLSDLQDDLRHAEALSHEACGIFRELGDVRAVAGTMVAMAFQARRQGRYAESTALFAETVTLWEQLGDATAADLARSNVATAAKTEGRFELARTLLEQVRDSAQARGDVRGVASALNGLGDLAFSQGNADDARRFHHESLERYRQIGDGWGVATVLSDLGQIDLASGDYAAARDRFRQALVLCREVGHQRGVARQLESLAWVAGCQALDAEAVTLASAAAAIRERAGAPPKQADQDKLNEILARARTRLGAAAYAEAWQRGRSRTIDGLLEGQPDVFPAPGE